MLCNIITGIVLICNVLSSLSFIKSHMLFEKRKRRKELRLYLRYLLFVWDSFHFIVASCFVFCVRACLVLFLLFNGIIIVIIGARAHFNHKFLIPSMQKNERYIVVAPIENYNNKTNISLFHSSYTFFRKSSLLSSYRTKMIFNW